MCKGILYGRVFHVPFGVLLDEVVSKKYKGADIRDINPPFGGPKGV